MNQWTAASMGENDFTYDCTPRLVNKVHKEVSEQVAAILRTKFSFVLVPPGKVGKTDHGDIAFQVGGPLDGKLMEPEALASIVGAMRVKTSYDHQPGWAMYAIKWPVHLKADIKPCEAPLPPHDKDVDAILVRIHQHLDPLQAEWTAYSHAFGNLRLVMDTILREYGIHHRMHPNDAYSGLVLRPAYLEYAISRGYYEPEGGVKSYEVLLTSDPSAILRFAGMIKGDEKWYDLRFDTQEQLADLLCRKNRFFDPDNLRSYQIHHDDTIAGLPNASKDFQFFKFFVLSFVPRHLARLRDQVDKTFTRDRAEEEARLFFLEADEAVEVKTHEARAVFAPAMFWTALEANLLALTIPEVTHELNMKRRESGSGFWAFFQLVFKLDIFGGRDEVNEARGQLLGAEDQDALECLVARRVQGVVRRVKSRTINFLASHQPGAPIPYEYKLWEAGRYEVLLAWCLGHRHEVEQRQAALRKENASR